MRMLACLAWLAIAGCARPPSVEIGTGEAEFVALKNGQDITLVRGAQGGHHMWMSLRVDGIKPEKVWLDTDVEHAGETSHSRNITKLTTEDDADYLIGWPLVMQDPASLDGELVRLRVTVTDVDGEAVKDTIDVRLHMP